MVLNLNKFRKLFVIFLFLVICAEAYCVDFSFEPDEDNNEYIENCLSIVDKTTTKISGGGYSGETYTSISANTYTVNDWKVYKGYNEISKADFFQLVKNKELFDKCVRIDKINSRKKKIADISLIAGGISAVGGLLCFIPPIINDNIDDGWIWGGVAAMSLGLIGLGIYYDEVESFLVPDIPMSIAIEIANNYNKQLSIKLKQGLI